MSERLDRIEKSLENLTNEVRTLAETSVRHDEQILELRQQIATTSQEIATLGRVFVETIGVIRTMQSEIRGIQTENQRILNHLFGENQE